MEKRSVLDDDRIGLLLFKLSTPAFFSMSVTMLYNIVNTIFISRYTGPLGIAGLSIVFPVQMLSMGIGQMAGMGGASYISRLIGSKSLPQAEKYLGNAITVSVVMSLVLSIVGLVNVDFWLRFLGASENILPYARDYCVVILAGNVFSIFASTASLLLIAEGNIRISMNGMIAGAVLNIILCSIFIIPLGWGIQGSALATVLAQTVTTAYYLYYYFKGRTFLRILPRNLPVTWDIVKGILAIGVSSFGRTMAGSVSAVIVNRLLLVYGGDIEISAYGLINRIFMFAIMPGMVIGQGLQPILGFNYGARHFDRVIKSIRLAIIWSTVISLAVCIIIYVFIRPIVAVFTSDTELADLTVSASRMVYLALYVIGFMIVGSTIFQSLGKSIAAFVTSMARPVLFLIPAILVLSHFFKLNGVWWAFPVAEWSTTLLILVILVPVLKQVQKMNVSKTAAAVPGAPDKGPEAIR
jgi:putative MATE family efflux protein